MHRYLFLLLIVISSCKEKPSSPLEPKELTCEYLSNPSVVDAKEPRLSWIAIDPLHTTDQKQLAYQIRVATSKENIVEADLWDSGKVISDKVTGIPYGGKKLTSRQECWWQVRIWDKNNIASEWSDISFWRMGLLNRNDWKAKWIGAPWQSEQALPKPQGGPNARPEEFGPPAPYLRKSFLIKKQVSKAIAYVTGLGYFEFYANGKKIGNDVLVPNQTNYGKRPNLSKSLINVEDNFSDYKVMYLAYDITEHLHKGENVIGSILGNGFYNPAKFWTEGYGSPRFIGQVHIRYKDGTEELIASDETWKVSKGPIRMDMVYYGETYDARNELEGWSTSGLNDAPWKNATLRKAPEGRLVAHTANTDQVTERIAPISIAKISEGKYKVDFGTEISGWVRLQNVEGPPGHKIDISFDANTYSGDNTYILKGNGKESYAPRFNWFVFSGVEINNWPGELTEDHIVAEMVNTYIEESSTFKTSNSLINDIHKIWKRSLVDNLHGGIMSDCPHRERSAYTGDAQVTSAMVMETYDAKNLYYKWILDIIGAQNVTTGYVPNAAPWQPGSGGGVAWGSAIAIIPWEYYLHYGDRKLLLKSYGPIKKYIEYMNSWINENGIMHSQRIGGNGEITKWFNLGEWESPGEPLRDDFVHTFYYWMCTDIAMKSAKVLGKTEDFHSFKNVSEATKKAFHKTFYNEEKGTYGNGGGNIMALKMGVPDKELHRVQTALKTNIDQNEGHLDTGIFGTRYFFEVLADNGLNHLAYEALIKKDEPGFGYWLSSGATTTREAWDNSGSHNHPMFGGGLVWLYRKLAGMQLDPNAPGYKHILFKPHPVEGLDYVEYRQKTPYGEASIYWENTKTHFKMDVIVPVGSSATVSVPVRYTGAKEFDATKILLPKKGIEFLKRENGYDLYEVKSGQYGFEVLKN
jgi:alpha-L-rhamnosidase